MVRRSAVWTLAITAACLPLYVVRWHVGPLPTTLLELLVFITVFMYGVVRWVERRPPSARTPYDIPIALLLVAGIASVAVAPDHLRALGIYRAYFIEAIAMFYVAVDLIRTRDDVQTFLRIAAIGALVMAAGQIVSFTWVAAHQQLQLGDAPAFLNTSPNADAMYLEPPLAFAAAFAMFPSRPRERLIAAPVLAIIFVAVILTLSRASYLAMAVLGIGLVLSLQSWRWRLRAVGALAAMTVILVEIPLINQRLADVAHSVTNRTSIYRQALEMLSQRPIFGAGFDGFPIRVAPFRPGTESIHLYPHNIWLTTWSEIGLLGVIAFAVIFFGLLIRGIRAVPFASDIYRPLLWGGVGTLVLYTVHGMFDSPYWKNDLSVEFWLVAALLVAGVRATRALPSRPDRPTAP